MLRNMMIVAALVGSAAQADPDWVYVTGDADANPVYVDGTSFTFERIDPDAVVTFWEKLRLKKTGHDQLSQERIDCAANQWQVMVTMERDVKGHLLHSYNWPLGTGMRPIPPESVIQQVRYIVCGEKNLHDLPPPDWAKTSG